MVRRLSTLAVFACATSLVARAQQAVSPDEGTQPAKLVATAATPRLDLATAAGVDYSSSSSSVDTPDSDGLGLEALTSAGMQPPPRRRYGRPRYNDSSHNPDGSNKYTFVLGAGFTAPVGNTYHYLNTSYGIQVGGGRNFNKNFGVLMQFDYDRFGFNGRTLYNEQSLYNYYCTTAEQNAGSCSPISGLDGNSHVWSFSLNPIYTIYDGKPLGAYVVAGVGFYHKVANFTLPTAACADYYCLYQYVANENIDHYTSNAPGFNGGFGLTFKPSRFSGEHLFVEGRYVFMDNSQRTGITVNSPAATLNSYAGSNFYPANSNRTTYTVYKAGVRF
jgi:hypothetical protein